MATIEQIQSALRSVANKDRAKSSAWFFKTGPGQYGEGDKFLGIRVPEQRKIARQFQEDLPLDEVKRLLESPWHEERLTSLFILVSKYKQAADKVKQEIASFYHKNRAYVNNWDLVDSSAPYILGDYLTNHSRAVLLRLARSNSVWDRRIAILSTFLWIRQGEFEDAFKVINILLNDEHDLIQKAVGWALREIGKADRKSLTTFLDNQASILPRTSLRYAIEHLTPAQRAHYLGMKNKPS